MAEIPSGLNLGSRDRKEIQFLVKAGVTKKELEFLGVDPKVLQTCEEPGIVKVSAPEMKVSAPEMKVSAPEIKVSTPEMKVSTPKMKVSTPEMKVSTPEMKVSTPEK